MYLVKRKSYRGGSGYPQDVYQELMFTGGII